MFAPLTTAKSDPLTDRVGWDACSMKPWLRLRIIFYWCLGAPLARHLYDTWRKDFDGLKYTLSLVIKIYFCGGKN